jgi:hypothetical protein
MYSIYLISWPIDSERILLSYSYYTYYYILSYYTPYPSYPVSYRIDGRIGRNRIDYPGSLLFNHCQYILDTMASIDSEAYYSLALPLGGRLYLGHREKKD